MKEYIEGKEKANTKPIRNTPPPPPPPAPIGMSDFKTVKLSPELHKKIKEYCDREGLKLNVWIERQLMKIIDEKCQE